ncbi:MAG TPA: S46 family peptidase [Longimicrobiales bacterium]|nr:S46 family peptidase [Longimicrobiales bacterium]
MGPRCKRALGLLPALVLVASMSARSAAQQSAPTLGPPAYVPEFGTMWTFDAPPLEYWKTRYNFTADQQWLDHVRLASVRLPNCSASFVSAQGLVLTNHHCARTCISAVSPADSNYQRTGFVAGSQRDEKKCPGLYVDQLQSIEDVTARVRARVTGTTPAARVEQRDAEIQAIQRECAQATGLICQVVNLYQGGLYSLYRYRRMNDIRLVMAPEEDISFFGGDPDNFTYPRYCLDLTLLRVYENDAPHQPKDFLKWSANGAAENELVFVTGNPGSTGRLLTVAQMEYLRDVAYPAQLAGLQRQIQILKQLAAQNEQNRRRYENALFSAENSFKAITGYRSGLTDSTIMARKRAFERELRARVAADPKLRGEYGGAWDAVAAAQKELTSIAAQARYYQLNGSALLSYAALLAQMPEQLALPEAQRLTQFQSRGIEQIRNALLSTAPVDLALEQVQLAGWLQAAQQELDPKDPLLVALLAGRKPGDAAAALLKGTKLGDVQVRKTLLDGGAQAVASSTDPLIVAVRRLTPTAIQLAQRVVRLNATGSANAEKIGQAQFALYGTRLPPDATFTLRISDGLVKGFPMNGTIAPYKTTWYGLYGRSAEFQDQPPFKLPERWKQARTKIDLATPINFVSTNDIIGGNSGSPVINRNGEVVGLIFDGNIESLPNRFIFTDDVARSVSVHSRAIVEALRNVYNAGWLATELLGR